MTYTNNEMVTEALNGLPVYEILNAVREEASPYYQRAVTEASAQNIQNVGAGINAGPALQNEFITLLLNGVVNLAMQNPNLSNDLKEFQGEFIPYGKTLQESATDVIEPIQFDEYLAEDKEKEIFKPRVSTRFHVNTREEQYPVSISPVLLQGAFENDTAFLNFVRTTINTLLDSNELGEYVQTVGLLESYYKNNKFYLVETPDVLSGYTDSAVEFIEKIKSISLHMTIGAGNRKFNNQGLRTRTKMEDLHLFLTPEMLSRFEMGVWARAFNLTEAQFKPNIHVVDKFGDSSELQGVMCDKDFFQIHPQLRQFTEAPNARGLYSTHYYSCFDIFSCSDFKNAVAFVSSVPESPVYDVVLPLSAVDIRRGGSLTFGYQIRQTDDEVYTPVFTVEANVGGGELSADTVFDGDTLTIGEDEKNQMLTVKATVTTLDSEGNDVDVVGTSLVKVVK